MKVLKCAILCTIFVSSCLFAIGYHSDEWRKYVENFSFNRSPDKYIMNFVYNDFDNSELISKMEKVSKMYKEGKKAPELSEPYRKYPNLRFYSSPNLSGTPVLEANQEGLFYKGKKKCPRLVSFNVDAFFCNNPLLKFRSRPGGMMPHMDFFFEFDETLRDDIVKTEYKGEDVYLDLKSIENFDRVPFDYSDFNPKGHLKEKGAQGYFWIEKPRNVLYKEFMNKYPFAKEFVKKLKKCLDKKEPKCLKEMSDETLYSGFFANVGPDELDNPQNWEFKNLPNFYTAIKGCFSKGRITSMDISEENDGYALLRLKNEGLYLFHTKIEILT